MILIDAKMKLNASSIQQLKDIEQNDTLLSIFGDNHDTILFEYKISELEQFFRDEAAEELFTDDNEVIHFVGEKAILDILGIDFKWHIATVRNTKYKSLEKLFNKKIEKAETKKLINLVHIDCITYSDTTYTTIVDSQSFDGNVKDAITFVNKLYNMHLLKNRFEDTMKFSINNKEAKTFNELVNEGVFIV